MIGKSIKTKDDKWLTITELPGDVLSVTGVEFKDNQYLITAKGIFSREAVEVMIDAFQGWLKE